MRINLTLLFFALFLSNSFAQTKKVRGDLETSDSTTLNVIKVSPDKFPDVSIVFEAIKKSQPIFGLKKENITVTEDGEPCEIVSLNEISQNYPINISLIIDHSGSMAVDYSFWSDTSYFKLVSKLERGEINELPEKFRSPLDNAKQAIFEFINTFESKKDSLQIVGFSNTSDIISEFSIDKKYLTNITDSMKADYNTAFLDAIDTTLTMLNDRDGINIIIALSDGMDNSSHVNSREVIRKANDYNIPVFNIGLGNIDKNFLKNISDSTNGAFYYTKESSSLINIYQEIQKRITSIYDLRYTSSNLDTNSTHRKILIDFDIDSIYLKNNLVDLNIPKETLLVLDAKNNRSKFGITGYLITGTILTSGALFFIYRRRKKRK